MEANIPQSIKTLISLISAKPDLNNMILKDFVIRSNIKQEDLLPWSDIDHPKNLSFGRKLIHDGGWFKIIVMTYNPGDFTGIHSHGYVDWGLIKYFGEGQKNIYHLENHLLTLYGIHTMVNGSFETIDNELIHQTGNNSDKSFLTLDIYGSERKKSEISEGTEIFDLNRMETIITNGSTYLDVPADDIIKKAKCPLPDKETFMYNAVLMLQHYCRQNDVSLNANMNALLMKMSDYYG